MAEVEKIAHNRYRLHAHDQLITLDAQDVLDIMEYALRYAAQLRSEQRKQLDNDTEKEYTNEKHRAV